MTNTVVTYSFPFFLETNLCGSKIAITLPVISLIILIILFIKHKFLFINQLKTHFLSTFTIHFKFFLVTLLLCLVTPCLFTWLGRPKTCAISVCIGLILPIFTICTRHKIIIICRIWHFSFVLRPFHAKGGIVTHQRKENALKRLKMRFNTSCHVSLVLFRYIPFLVRYGV